MDSGKSAAIMSNMTKLMRFEWCLQYTMNKKENIKNSGMHIKNLMLYGYEHWLIFQWNKFESQHPQDNLQSSVTAISGNLMPFSDFHCHQKHT